MNSDKHILLNYRKQPQVRFDFRTVSFSSFKINRITAQIFQHSGISVKRSSETGLYKLIAPEDFTSFSLKQEDGTIMIVLKKNGVNLLGLRVWKEPLEDLIYRLIQVGLLTPVHVVNNTKRDIEKYIRKSLSVSTRKQIRSPNNYSKPLTDSKGFTKGNGYNIQQTNYSKPLELEAPVALTDVALTDWNKFTKEKDHTMPAFQMTSLQQALPYQITPRQIAAVTGARATRRFVQEEDDDDDEEEEETIRTQMRPKPKPQKNNNTVSSL